MKYKIKKITAFMFSNAIIKQMKKKLLNGEKYEKKTLSSFSFRLKSTENIHIFFYHYYYYDVHLSEWNL